ncbi:MAG: hypothetical protein JW995_14465 [Melioribacteraceae bacterium]|nr:hypothetical protein [Melioribacteraceae bacterium]
MAITTDESLIKQLVEFQESSSLDFQLYEKELDPLDVMSFVCTTTPSVLLIDDDCLKPNTAHILRSIKKVNKNLRIIFFTSDSSLELGREISPLGIHFYGIKPVDYENIENLLTSMKNQLINSNNSLN